MIKPIKIKSKKKHLNSTNHKYLSNRIIIRHIVPNSYVLGIENILTNYVLDYNKKFEIYTIICKWTLHFSDTITSVKYYLWSNISSGFYLRNLLSKIKYFESHNHKFSHISEMNITFLSDIGNMTIEYYLTHPKPRLEFNAILLKNPRLVTLLDDSIHPLLNKYAPFITTLMEKIRIFSK